MPGQDAAVQFDPNAAYSPSTPSFDPNAGYAAAPTGPTGAIPHPHPGTSIHWINPPGTQAERKQATAQVLAGSMPAVGATVGEIAGPPGAATGAFLGTEAEPFFTGGHPDVGEGTKNAAIFGAGSMLGKSVGMLRDWFGFGAKTGPEEWQAINDALGVRKTQVRLPLGATSVDDAYGIPGRSVAARAGVTSQELAKMTPFEQAARIAPSWKAAGAEIDAIADTATKSGLKFDVGKSVTQAVGQIDSLQVQERAIKVLSDTAKQLGIQDWRTVTPNEALRLRAALWDNFGGTQWGKPLYGAVTRDIKAAVPQLGPADQAYSELRGAMDAIRGRQQATMAKAPVSAAAKAWQSLPRPIRATAPFVLAAGGGIAGDRLFGYLRNMLGPGAP